MVIRKKRTRSIHRYLCHFLASNFASILINSELIDNEELTEISQSTFEGITGKTVKLSDSTPEKHIGRLNKILSLKDKAPALTERLANNVDTLAECLQLDDIAASIIQFTAVMTLNKSLFELINSYAYYRIESMAHLLSILLNIDELLIETALDELWSIGLLISSRLAQMNHC